MLKFHTLNAVTFLTTFRMSGYAYYDSLRNLIGPGHAAKLDKKSEFSRRQSNRWALFIDEINCLSCRILGGSTYIDACWSFNAAFILYTGLLGSS